MAKFVTSSAHSCSELEEAARFLETTGFLEAPGGLGTKALPNTRSDVSARLFPAFNIVKETLFIDLTLCKNGNWKENGALTVVTG